MSGEKFVIVREGNKTVKKTEAEFADLFLDYAVLSSNIYWPNSSAPEFIPVNGWQMLNEGSLPPVPPPKFKSQKNIKGLKYQVWYSSNNGKTRAALVFKGTTFTFLNDWICNLRWATLNPVGKRIFYYFLWDYYHQVQVVTPLLIENTQKMLPGHTIEFIATGHSLGGGLAQQAAYSCDHIKKVIVFDPSPVTGYKDIKKELRVLYEKGIDTSRVYHKGEILSYIRNFIRVFILPLSTINPSIKEYQYSFLNGSAIKKHAIRDFALYLSGKKV